MKAIEGWSIVGRSILWTTADLLLNATALGELILAAGRSSTTSAIGALIKTEPLDPDKEVLFELSVRYRQYGVDLHDWRVCSVLPLWYGLGGKLSNDTFSEKEAVG